MIMVSVCWRMPQATPHMSFWGRGRPLLFRLRAGLPARGEVLVDQGELAGAPHQALHGAGFGHHVVAEDPGAAGVGLEHRGEDVQCPWSCQPPLGPNTP